MRLATTLCVVVASMLLFALPAAAKGDEEAGKKIFEEACRSCHGLHGEGNPAMYRKAKAKIVHLGSAEAQHKSDDFIRKAITEGWQKMDEVEEVTTPQQVEDVLAFVRLLKLDGK